jgi:hypothetical protein
MPSEKNHDCTGGCLKKRTPVTLAPEECAEFTLRKMFGHEIYDGTVRVHSAGNAEESHNSQDDPQYEKAVEDATR